MPQGPISKALISIFCSPQSDTSRSCKTMDTGLVHCLVCVCYPAFAGTH